MMLGVLFRRRQIGQVLGGKDKSQNHMTGNRRLENMVSNGTGDHHRLLDNLAASSGETRVMWLAGDEMMKGRCATLLLPPRPQPHTWGESR